MSKVVRNRPTGDSPLGRTPLVANVEAPIVGAPPAAPSRTPAVPDSVSPAPPAAPATAPPGDQPLYLTLVRKEARLRVEQVDALTHLTRRLTRQRAHRGGERLTDNTLIRVAVDALLARAGDLHGNTEEELRASLGLAPD